jgi:hypothetical protein
MFLVGGIPRRQSIEDPFQGPWFEESRDNLAHEGEGCQAEQAGLHPNFR